MRNVCIVAGGMSMWGVRHASLRDIFQEAAKACYDSNKALTNKDIDGLLVASSHPERSSFQTHLAPVVAEYVGVKPKNICTRVEALCASGSSAIILAAGLIKSGMADIIMVLGGEKLYMPEKWEVFYHQLASPDHEWDSPHGLGLPAPGFAMVAKLHMKKYGTTKEQMAKISIKNRRNGVNNPYAHFQKKIDLDEVLNAKDVVYPLSLLDCCPVTDGCAACILACEERAKDLTDRPLVYFLGSAQATLNHVTANIPNWTTWEALRVASKRAYEVAGVKPGEINVAQTHDCFSISEIVEYEDLGFCEKGEGGDFIETGRSDFGGKIPVNTDGGLLSCGHPFGGTGIRQGIETMRQLRGDAVNQVAGARLGLTHNMGGVTAVHTIVIYGRKD